MFWTKENDAIFVNYLTGLRWTNFGNRCWSQFYVFMFLRPFSVWKFGIKSRERSANELSYDNKVQFWVDFTQKFSEDKKRLSFTISDLEEYVLSLCPYRPLCLNSIFEADNESSIMLKDNYESSGNHCLLTISLIPQGMHAVRGSPWKFINMEIVELFNDNFST